mmetsp:Transcript_1462/g.2127  ORF Transcript_1462/g.2127 Transcript_1462/m.2127 type:complete len:692 (-) Transcript_1462:1071-3146(-)
MSNNERLVQELRYKIDGLLSETGLYAKIRELIQEVTAGEDENDQITKATLARLVSSVEQPPKHEEEDMYREGDFPMALLGGNGNLEKSATKLALKVEILGAVGLAGEAAEAITKGVAMGIKAHVGFNGQRGETGLVRASAEPAVQGSFLFEIEQPLPTNEASWRSVLSRPASMVRFYLTRERIQQQSSLIINRRDLCATTILDWRQALLRPGEAVEIPLTPIGTDAALESGLGEVSSVLHIILDVVALGGDDEDTLETPFDDEAVRREMNRCRSAKAQAARRFFLYAKQWWTDYAHRLSADNTPPRSVQLFARDEANELRCACSFIWPLRATGRGLDSPRHCARFVSLLALEKDPGVGGSGDSQPWQTPLAFMARRAGDVCDHALLLCSLFLGFGLEAYVALGEMRCDGQTQPHAWVLTFSTDESTGNQKAAAWESTTGRRTSLLPLDPETARRYDSITALFNHEIFLANVQTSHLLVDGISLDLDDDRLWKSIDSTELGLLLGGGPQHPMPYIPAIADIALLPPIHPSAIDIETELRTLIQRRRLEDHGLLTVWDPELSYMLSPALVAYEHTKLTGQALGNDDFADAIKRHVPKGHCFKGFPTCFPHLQPTRMITALLRAELSADVIATAGDHVRHAIRIRIFSYAEGVSACWVMIAVRYLNPSQPLVTQDNAVPPPPTAAPPPPVAAKR